MVEKSPSMSEDDFNMLKKEALENAELALKHCTAIYEKQEQVLDKILNKLGINLESFSPEVQQSVIKACRILNSWNVENVSEGAIMAKFSANVLECVEKEEKNMKHQERLVDLDNILFQVGEINNRLEMDIKFHSKKIDNIIHENEDETDPDSLLTPEEPLTKLPEIEDMSEKPQHEVLIDMFNEVNKLKEEDAEVQKKLDEFADFPPDLNKAEEMVAAMRIELKKACEELKNFNFK